MSAKPTMKSGTSANIKTIVNRNGVRENFDISRIQTRLQRLADQKIAIDDAVDPPIDCDAVNIGSLIIGVGKSLHDNMKTSDIDTLTAIEAVKQIMYHPDYDRMATRILVSNLHKEILPDIRAYAEALYRHKDNLGRHIPRISKGAYDFYCTYSTALNEMLVHNRDYLYRHFGIETMIKQYLTKLVDPTTPSINKPTKIAERPQHLHLRVAIQGEIDINSWTPDQVTPTVMENIKIAYDMMSKHVFTHATPTLLNSCRPRNQLISCNLDAIPDDSEGIMDAAKRAALLSRSGAGLGYAISDVRAAGSLIKGSGGQSEGIVNFVKIFDILMAAFNQNGDRKGSCKITIEPWHADIMDFLDLKLQQGDSSRRARNLFYAVHINDEFMRRVDCDEPWYLMCPEECPGLTTTWGLEFAQLYNKYVAAGRYRKVMKAIDLFREICIRMLKTGLPYITFKDAINRKSNHQGWGTVKSLNLCVEIALPAGLVQTIPHGTAPNPHLTNPKLPNPTNEEMGINQDGTVQEVANCNLSSISLKQFVKRNQSTGALSFDFVGLAKISRLICRRLDNIISFTNYSVSESHDANMRHRPIGIGIQGLQNVFYMTGLEWGSDQAKQLDEDIMEAVLFGALTESTSMAKQFGTYPSHQRSPAAMGYLQPDLWLIEQAIHEGKLPDLPLRQLLDNHKEQMPPLWKPTNGRFDWETLRGHIAKFGLRNAELTSPMPTASTSQLLGNCESFEPANSNIFKRDTLAGSFVVLNEYLVKELMEMKLWSEDMLNVLVQAGGSIQNIDGLPDSLKRRYKTVWEIKQRVLVDAMIARGKFVTMSQSFNQYFQDQPPETVGTAIMYVWRHGGKAIYYTRSRQGGNAQSFAISKDQEQRSALAIADAAAAVSDIKDTTIDTKPLFEQETVTEEICFLCSS